MRPRPPRNFPSILCFATGFCEPVCPSRNVTQIQTSGNDTWFVSANRMCELGMRQTTGRVYESFIYALEEATRVPE